MARSCKKSIDEALVPIQGTPLVRRMRRLLTRLRQAGCERDRAGNRKLFFDDYACLLLLYFFTPAIDSLRALQQVSGWEKTRRKLGIRRSSLGSLGEAARVFDARLLDTCRAG